jgi:hypothetical protein
MDKGCPVPLYDVYKITLSNVECRENVERDLARIVTFPNVL